VFILGGEIVEGSRGITEAASHESVVCTGKKERFMIKPGGGDIWREEARVTGVGVEGFLENDEEPSAGSNRESKGPLGGDELR